MKRRTRANSSSLFLMEMILAIFFFILASASCVQIFVKAHTLSKDSARLNLSVNEVSNACELILAGEDKDDILNLISRQYPEGTWEDSSFEVTLPDEDGLLLRISLTEKEDMVYGDVEAWAEEEKIFAQDITHHLQRRVPDEKK